MPPGERGPIMPIALDRLLEQFERLNQPVRFVRG